MKTQAELERRQKEMFASLESLSERMKQGLLIVPTPESKNTMTVVNNAYIIKTDESTENAVTGSEKMRSVGGGVKAKMVKVSGSNKFVIESFIFDKDRFTEDGVRQWLIKHEASMLECLSRVQESIPAGSFTDIALRLQRAVNMMPDYSDRYVCVCWIFPEYVIVDIGEETYQINYKDENGVIKLGTPSKVEMTFVQAQEKAYKEKLERTSKPNFDLTDITESFRIRETVEDKREVIATLIEAGTNMGKKRHYPKDTIREAAPSFAGLKMYLDHPTPTEDKEKPERSISDWLSTVVESWYEDGKAMGRIKVHDDWLWTQLKDSVFREHIGLSINASGKRYFRNIEGQNMEVIEQIVSPRSVDWVTEPGARGRVEYLLESQKREDNAMLKTVKLEEVQKERPDLVAEIRTSLMESVRAELTGEYDKKLQEALKPYKEADEKARKAEQKKKITAIAESSKLPKKAISSFVDKFVLNHTDIKDEELETKVKEALTAEIKYLNECGLAITIGVEPGTVKVKEAGEKPTPSTGLLEVLGVAEEKKSE